MLGASKSENNFAALARSNRAVDWRGWWGSRKGDGRMTVATNSVRIAMWSGPRNISTAMMRAWGNRADTVVVDEPLYACYLKTTGKKHPGAEEVIATGETDWRKVISQLAG